MNTQLKVSPQPISKTLPKSDSFLKFENVGKVYPTPKGPYPVLQNINLTVEAGEFICVIGHSVCGKSTLLNMVSGFQQPTSGSVTLRSHPITGPGPGSHGGVSKLRPAALAHRF